jgi:hypothetical protein
VFSQQLANPLHHFNPGRVRVGKTDLFGVSARNSATPGFLGHRQRRQQRAQIGFAEFAHSGGS